MITTIMREVVLERLLKGDYHAVVVYGYTMFAIFESEEDFEVNCNTFTCRDSIIIAAKDCEEKHWEMPYLRQIIFPELRKEAESCQVKK